MKHNDQDTMARMRREVDVGKGRVRSYRIADTALPRGETTLCNRERPSRNPGVERSQRTRAAPMAGGPGETTKLRPTRDELGLDNAMPTPQARTLEARSERGHASSKDFATAAQSSQKCAQTQPRPRVGVEWVGPKEERESVISPSATEDGQQCT